MAADATPSEIVLVTGANQGLGLAVIEVAGLRYPNKTYILCSRNMENGNSAITKLRQAGVKAKVDLVQLEVTNDDDIAAAVKHVETEYGRLDGKNTPTRRETAARNPSKAQSDTILVLLQSLSTTLASCASTKKTQIYLLYAPPSMST
jgi:NAD(P)-dependent dehydrogenase (short-subunit alcohol dehydrogenase family)